MYHRILVAIEHSPADQAILDHVRQLAAQFGSELHLVHVADGWVAGTSTSSSCANPRR